MIRHRIFFIDHGIDKLTSEILIFDIGGR